MAQDHRQAALRLLKKEWDSLTATERRVIEHINAGRSITRHAGHAAEDGRSLGERLSDQIASFGGSWAFIIMFGGLLAAWVALNVTWLLGRWGSFDPYPFIFLNLVLSALAAFQAPVILMSSNRQTERDRDQALHDYEVNLKAELEIRTLHEKIDEIRAERWTELVKMQQEQIRMLESLVAARSGS